MGQRRMRLHPMGDALINKRTPKMALAKESLWVFSLDASVIIPAFSLLRLRELSMPSNILKHHLGLGENLSYSVTPSRFWRAFNPKIAKM